MLNELIAKIAAQTGQPVEAVTPIVGALLAHLGDVLPAPIAHEIAVVLGVQTDPSTTDAAAGTAPGIGGLLGSLEGSLAGGVGGGSPGASALVNVAQSLLGGFLANRR
jgi:hypothetical protein